MEINETRRSFRTLDGLRGVAALLVVSRHLGPMSVSLPNTFLAVDLFFLLSGFVIAHAYDPRLARGGFFSRFAKIRLIRLYPLYLLGLVIGVVAHAGGNSGMPVFPLIMAAVIGMLMIPANPFLPFGSSTLNGPAWTLPLELFANLLYAALFPFMRISVLISVLAIGATGIVISDFRGSLDLGWDFNDLPVALSRMMFSFSAGVLMHRLSRQAPDTLRPYLAWGCVIALCLLLLSPIPGRWSTAYQTALIFFAFPILVWVATFSEPGRRTGKLFRFLGVVSYALYATHRPLGILFVRLANKLAHPQWGDMHAYAATLFTAGLVPVCFVLDEYYDAPVRRWLALRIMQPGNLVLK